MSLRPASNQRSLLDARLLYGRLLGQPQGPAGRFEFLAERVLPQLYALPASLPTLDTAPATAGRPKSPS